MAKKFSSGINWDGPHRYFLQNTSPEALLADQEPPVCKRKGCKNHLSIQEQLFGDICQQCSQPFYMDNFIGEFEFLPITTIAYLQK